MEPLRTTRTSLADQAKEYLIGRIKAGIYRPGSQLPAEARLARELGISRPTLREALTNMEREGLVLRRHGLGTFVAPDPERWLEPGLERLNDRWAGLAVQVERTEVQPAEGEIGVWLNLSPEDNLVYREMLVQEEGRPLARVKEWVPAQVLVLAAVEGMGNQPLLDLLGQAGRAVRQSEATLVPVMEGERPVIQVKELYFDRDMRPVALVRSLWLSDSRPLRVIRR